MDIVRAAARSVNSVAVKCPRNGNISYGQLLAASDKLVDQLSPSLPVSRGADGPRIGVYADPGAEYVAATWAAWKAGGIAVPLAVTHPPHELQYVMQDAGICKVLAPPSSHEKLHAACKAAGAHLQELPQDLLGTHTASTGNSSSSSGQHAASSSSNSPHAEASTWPLSSSSSSEQASGALIVYTSGTTGRPKGALHTHGSVAAQVGCLVSAWQWAPSDTILHALPLHHVHGIINALYCAHAVGATVDFLPKFSPAAVWQHLMGGDVSVLMAVPTMYTYLLNHYEQHMSPDEQEQARAAAAGLRLAVSGSAAAPVPLLQRWKQLSGQMLLERYGMTETGMILSNPYEAERRPGFVGVPLPGVEVKVLQQQQDDSSMSSSSSIDGDGGSGCSSSSSSSSAGVEPAGQAVQGELAVRGPMLFREYWGRPEATAAAFDADGYFPTGDTVSSEGQPPYFKISGRTSVDIIKSGGHKLSALDIESTLLQHRQVAETAVLGVPDDQLGQVVTALVYPKAQEGASGSNSLQDQLVSELQQLCAESLASYSIPRKWLLLEAPLPRNAMGKVNKKELLREYAVQLQQA